MFIKVTFCQGKILVTCKIFSTIISQRVLLVNAKKYPAYLHKQGISLAT